MIEIKTKAELATMKEGGKISSRILKLLVTKAVPGISTGELDKIAQAEIAKAGAKPSFLGHAGFPAAICTSINDEVVHGIPSLKRILKGCDLLGLDIGVNFKGFHTDTAITVPVGTISFDKKELLRVTKKSLDEGLALIKPGIHLGDIQHKIQSIIEKAGFGVIRDLSGHGIGKNLQEMPSIPNFGKTGSGPVLKEGMTIAIEPMVAAGDWHVVIGRDGWTVKTADGSDSAHFEHTVAVTSDGYEILT